MLSCLVLAVLLVDRSEDINDAPATAPGDAVRGTPAQPAAPRVVVAETYHGAVFVDVEDNALDHERINTFLAARPVAAYRVVVANATLLRSYMQTATDQRSFGLLFLGPPRVEFGYSKRDDDDVAWPDPENDWNLDIWSGAPHSIEGGQASLIVDAEDAITAEVLAHDSQILVEPLGKDGHHVIWRSTTRWRNQAAAAGAVKTLTAVVESIGPEENDTQEALALEAARRLALMNTAASIRALDDLLASELEERGKRWIVLLLFKTDTDQSRELIRKTAANPTLSTHLRALALRTTSVYNTERDANLYRSMLYHDESAIRATSAVLLSRIDAAEAAPHLVAAVLDDSLPDDYWSIALGRLRDSTGALLLSGDLAQLDSPSEQRRLVTDRVAEWAATQ